MQNSSGDSENPDREEMFIPIAIDERPVPVKNPEIGPTSSSKTAGSDNVKPVQPRPPTPERVVVPRPGRCACAAKNRSRVLNTGLLPGDPQDSLSIVFIGEVPTDKPINHRIGFEIRDQNDFPLYKDVLIIPVFNAPQKKVEETKPDEDSGPGNPVAVVLNKTKSFLSETKFLIQLITICAINWLVPLLAFLSFAFLERNKPSSEKLITCPKDQRW